MRIISTSDRLIDERSALALGFFDGVHLGHQAIITRVVECSARGLAPAVFTFGTDGGAPAAKLSLGLIQSPALKAEVLGNLGIKYLYRPDFEEIRDMSAEQFVRDIILDKLKANVVCCGRDFRFGSGALGDITLLAQMLARAQVQLDVLPDVMLDGLPVSSSRIRGAISEGDMAMAERMLGRPFAIDSTVEHGRRLGSSMGLPTANQRLGDDIIRPRFGVYASRVTVGGKTYPAASNVGIKPTVGSDSVLCESYIPDFSGNIYGERIKTELIRFLRPEQRFDSLNELRCAMLADTRASLELLR